MGDASVLVPKLNQDAACMCVPDIASPPAAGQPALLGVFDGHGPSGGDVACFAASRLAPSVMGAEVVDVLAAKPQAVLGEAVTACDDELEETLGVQAQRSGTTAVLALLLERQVVVATTGDSRCVLAQERSDGGLAPLELSPTHSPDEPEVPRPLPGPLCRYRLLPNDDLVPSGP